MTHLILTKKKYCDDFSITPIEKSTRTKCVPFRKYKNKKSTRTKCVPLANID